MELLIVDDEIFAIEGIKAGVNWEETLSNQNHYQ